jgi:hypothetical protein
MCKLRNAVSDEIRNIGNIFALDCLNYMLLAYPLTSAHMFASSATATYHIEMRYTMLQKVSKIAFIVAELLAICPLKNEIGNPREAAIRLAGTPVWRLLKAKYAAQDLFCAGLLLFDELLSHAKHVCSLEGEYYDDRLTCEKVFVKVKSILNSALQRRPKSIRQMFQEIETVAGLLLFVDPRDAKQKKTTLSYVSHNRPNQALFDDLEGVLGISPLAVEHLNSSSDDSTQQSTMPGFDDSDVFSERRTVLLGQRRSSLGLGDDDCKDSNSIDASVECTSQSASFDFNDSTSYDPANRITDEKTMFIPPHLLSASTVLTHDMVYALGLRLPRSVSSSDWKLVFSLDRHGASLSTLLSLCANVEPTLVAISDEHGTVFGGFAAGSSWSNQGGSSFFWQWRKLLVFLSSL